ncbi:unnamed protein product [Chironomus riparius]|uniref:Uncharacterized protein n=1 Tax=Chironomus riparius TaxID=315576 RepID=A0A9N9RJQ9_9DIPT|nr:unnamed protein product [Chironomus riparius]
MSCYGTCKMPLSSKLMQQTNDFCSCNECKIPRKIKNSKRKKKSQVSGTAECQPRLDCNKDFTPSGMNPEVTAGPIGNDFKCCTTYADCGCWSTCKDGDHAKKNCFKACPTNSTRAPFGPYGPWNNNGPSQFKIMRKKYIQNIYPPRKTPRYNGLQCPKDEPMGKIRLWPLSGSCRYAGRPYGPCRPFGAYQSRGPFGIWKMAGHPKEYIGRPDTPAQPCWKQAKPGYRPCTPCQRPLYRPCRNKCMESVCCKYVELASSQNTCDK